jgi:translocation and assembly module TamA
LLGKHLELQRYRELADLSDSELDRLLVAARLNAQDLLATLGYFAPVIDIQFQPTPGAARLVRLRVEPGEPTLVREVRIEFSGPIQTDSDAQAQRQRIEESWSLRVGSRFTQAGWDAAKKQALRDSSPPCATPPGRLSLFLWRTCGPRQPGRCAC